MEDPIIVRLPLISIGLFVRRRFYSFAGPSGLELRVRQSGRVSLIDLNGDEVDLNPPKEEN